MVYPVDTDSSPSVALGGQIWPIPALAARQNRIIDPLILSLLPMFSEWQSDKTAALAKLGATQYEALLEIAFQAIRRAHPELTCDQFLDLPVTLPELVAAFPVIARQTGVFERASPGEETAGEPAGPPDWDAVIAHVCHLTGWTWDYADATLTVPRLKALHEEWRRNPPLPMLFAAWLGFRPKELRTAEDLVERLKGMQGVKN